MSSRKIFLDDNYIIQVTLLKLVLQIILIYVSLMVYFGSYGTGDNTLIDMTHSYTNETIHWPTLRGFNLDIQYRGDNGEHWFEANNFATSEHCGTHMDAPSHMVKGKWRLGEIPTNRFIIDNVVVIDITAKARINPDAELTVDDITNWEKLHSKIPDNSVVFMYSGWDEKWPNKTLYLGTEEKNVSILHFPGFNPDAAKWLVDNRKIYAVGVDTTSIDYGPSTVFLTHRTLYNENIIGLENVKNLKMLPPFGAKIYMFPMKIEDASGAPCRIMAELRSVGSLWSRCCVWIVMILLIIVIMIL